MIGTSVSFCVRDILNGKVDIDDVEKIYGNTKAPDRSTWEEVCEHYLDAYWGHHRARQGTRGAPDSLSVFFEWQDLQSPCPFSSDQSPPWLKGTI